MHTIFSVRGCAQAGVDQLCLGLVDANLLEPLQHRVSFLNGLTGIESIPEFSQSIVFMSLPRA